MDKDIAFECFTMAGVYLKHPEMSDVGGLLLKASGRIEFLEQQLSDLSKRESGIKAQGIREAVRECEYRARDRFDCLTVPACRPSKLLEYADNLIKENKCE